MVNYRLLFACLVLALSMHSRAFAVDGAAPPDSVDGGRPETVVIKPGSRSTLENDLFKSGGFIADKLKVYGKIVAAPAPGSERLLFGKNDYVYVNISQDYADQFTDYFIVEIGDTVKHPKTGKNMGKLITIIGQLRLIGQEAGYKKAIITESTREIALKQPIIPSYVFQRPEDSDTLKPGINGLIMKVLPMHLLGAQYQILYVDKGTDDGLKSGDMFTVMSTTKPISPVGRIKILSTQKNTATAYVIESKTSIFVGDTF
ncbi:MAG: hypothetical protein HQK96_10525 [Nitrospirae bacterium]|nr:hypothetical protein [Nitrospirota bacterium]